MTGAADGDAGCGPPEGAPSVGVDGVTVELGGRRVLDGVDLGVEAGSFLALVGPNGAGKTTLLRTVNGLVAPAAGRVTVDGVGVDGLSARELARREAGDAVDEAEGGRADHISVRSEHAALADQLKITLHHRHVPKLEEAGLVDYDAEVKQVALDHLPPEVEPVVERTTA